MGVHERMGASYNPSQEKLGTVVLIWKALIQPLLAIIASSYPTKKETNTLIVTALKLLSKSFDKDGCPAKT